MPELHISGTLNAEMSTDDMADALANFLGQYANTYTYDVDDGEESIAGNREPKDNRPPPF